MNPPWHDDAVQTSPTCRTRARRSAGNCRRANPGVRVTESLRSVPFEGVRSADPPRSSGSAGPNAFSAACDDWRVASALPSACARADVGVAPDRRTPRAGRRPCAVPARRPAPEIPPCMPHTACATPAPPARPCRACPRRRECPPGSRTAARSIPGSCAAAAISSAPGASPCMEAVPCLFGAPQPITVLAQINDGRLSFRPRCRQGGRDCGAVLTVDAGQHMPTIGLEAFGRVVAEPPDHLAVDGDAVVVVHADELAQLLHAGERGHLVRDALHHAAVAEKHVGVMIDDVVAGAVEGGAKRALRQRHAHGIGNTLAQRPGGGFDPEVQFALRVAGGLGAELAKILDLVHRQGIAREMQHRIQQHGRVAVRQHESVAVPPVRIARIELKHVAPQHLGDVGHPHGRARMARIGLLDSVHRQGTNGVGKLAASGHNRLLV